MKKNNSAYSNQTGTDNASMTGAYWTGITDYTYSPAGVNQNFTKYLPPSRLNPPQPQATTISGSNFNAAGDPFNDSDIREYGGDYGNFWKMVFPIGSNDCDLQAAIDNITAKIAQLEAVMNFPSGGAWNFAYNWVGAPQDANKFGTRTKAYNGVTPMSVYNYVTGSYGTLKTILPQYQATYNSHLSSGGGCSHGLKTEHYNAYVSAMQNDANNIKTQQEALNLEAQANAQKIEEGLAAENAFGTNSAEASAMQGAAAGSAAGGSILGLAPVTLIMYAVMGVIVIGGIAYFAHKKNNPAQ